MYDLNKDFSEYFEFKVNGVVYSFRYPTTKEVGKLKEFTTSNEGEHDSEIEEYLFSFISNATEGEKPFSDMWQDMISPQRKKFIEMITTELA